MAWDVFQIKAADLSALQRFVMSVHHRKDMGSKDNSFGGLEETSSAKTMIRHDNLHYVKGKATEVLRNDPDTTKEKKRKNCRRDNSRPWDNRRPWASLNYDLLLSIIMKVNMLEYFAIGAVCRSWRSVMTSWREYYMKEQKPFVIVKSRWAKKTCLLYDIFDRKGYKTLLPDLQSKRFLGVSCGYLITMDPNNGFWLINLMTRHELCYPALPDDKKYVTSRYELCYPYVRSILFKSTRHPQVCMVVVFRRHNCLLLSENGAERWKVYTIPNANRGIADVKVFEKKIYVVSTDARICVLDFSASRSSPVMKLYDGNIRMDRLYRCTHLAILDNQLWMRAAQDSYNICTVDNLLYQLDDTNMVWVEVKETGKNSLFLDWATATMVDSSNTGSGNSIFFIDAMSSIHWSIYHLDKVQRPERGPATPDVNDYKMAPWFWYHPGKSCTSDHVEY